MGIGSSLMTSATEDASAPLVGKGTRAYGDMFGAPRGVVSA